MATIDNLGDLPHFFEERINHRLARGLWRKTRGPVAVKTTDSRGANLWSCLEGVLNKPRNNATAVVHKLRNLVLFRQPASTTEREVAGHLLSAAISSQSRPSGDCGRAVVLAAIVWRAEASEATWKSPDINSIFMSRSINAWILKTGHFLSRLPRSLAELPCRHSLPRKFRALLPSF